MSELLNGKFKCVVSEFCDVMTEGKIYEFKDGRYTTDENDLCNITYRDIEHFNGISPNIIKIEPYTPQPKDLLQMGRIVKHQNGEIGFVLKHSILYPHGLNPISIFREDLTTPSGKYDITEIYESTEASCFNYDNFIEHLGELVWKREENTPQQIERQAIEQEQRELAEKMEQLADRIAQLKI